MTPLTGDVARIEQRLVTARRLWLFLDYDGTLDDFAPTPDDVLPNPEVIAVLRALQANPALRVTLLSGRRLAHIEKLAPVPGLMLAGTYGIEIRLPDGERVERVPHAQIRPTLEALKPRWAALIADHEGFYLEDKGWALALHGRFADDAVAEAVFATARAQLEALDLAHFRMLGGHKFLELGARLAHKGRAIEHLLAAQPLPGALLLYLGDDDKDEEAFAVVQAHGGLAVVVAGPERESCADGRLPSPQAARAWLMTLAELNPPPPGA